MKPSEAIKFKRPLRAHQIEDLDRFAPEKEMALFWEMGTGKTTSAIAWLRTKYNIEKDVSKTLIVSPVATLQNWVEEFKINAPEKVAAECFVPYMKTKRVKYTLMQRCAAIVSTDKKIIILNPESLDSKDVVNALCKWAPKNLILDEAHRMKGHKTTRLAALLKISDRVENRAILTGTPILNSYLDLWAQYRILDRGETFGQNFFVFRARYFYDKNVSFAGKAQYYPDWQPKPGIAQEISQLLARKASRRMSKDCLDLPPLNFEKRVVEMGAEQAKAYFQMENEMVALVGRGECAATNALSRVTRMLQILAGYLPLEYDDAPETVDKYFEKNPKLEELRILLEELCHENKVIIWSQYRATYPMIRSLLKKLGLQWVEIIGGTVDRQGAIERFRDDESCRVVLANPQAGGVGIGLQAAAYAIYYSRGYSLGDRLQSLKRNHRGGSEIHDKITIIDLVTRDTLDVDVLDALLRKENFSENVLARIQSRC